MTKHIIFLSGILCDWGLWDAQMEALSDIAECQCIPPSGATLHEMANAVLNEAPERFILAASSMGGYIAMELLQIAPQRVEKLILSNTSARQDHPKQRDLRLSTIEELKSGAFDTVVERLLPALVSPARRQDEALTTKIRTMMHRVGLDTTLRQQQATLDRPDFRPSLQAVTTPTLVITAAHDRVTPSEHGEEIADIIKHAKHEHLTTAGHLAPIESADEVTNILRDWLSS